uniref:hypothetical protein n=1 Tax=uncultured Roseobacter sp. TaxID=114847 RepID=UPI00262ECE57
DRKLNSGNVIDALSDLFILRAVPSFMAEAERVFQQETEKLRKVAKAAGKEAKTAAAEAKAEADDAASEETAAETAAQKTKAAAKRVADAAKSEAKSQNLGGAKP